MLLERVLFALLSRVRASGGGQCAARTPNGMRPDAGMSWKMVAEQESNHADGSRTVRMTRAFGYTRSRSFQCMHPGMSTVAT